MDTYSPLIFGHLPGVSQGCCYRCKRQECVALTVGFFRRRSDDIGPLVLLSVVGDGMDPRSGLFRSHVRPSSTAAKCSGSVRIRCPILLWTSMPIHSPSLQFGYPCNRRLAPI